MLPANLLDAVAHLQRTTTSLRDWLGHCAGRELPRLLREGEAAEWQEYHAQVSDWELQEYLTLF